MAENSHKHARFLPVSLLVVVQLLSSFIFKLWLFTDYILYNFESQLNQIIINIADELI